MPQKFKSILLPVRPQPDTVVAIFILRQFGEDKFPGISKANYIFSSQLGEGETTETLMADGTFPLDIGGGETDHHNKSEKTTVSRLVSKLLGVENNPALSKLLQYAERDDFYGKGTLSTDPLDRAFGLSGLITSLNKKYFKEPEKVIEFSLPLIDCFYTEEEKRAVEMPKEVEEKLATGKAQILEVRQRGKPLKVIFMDTENPSMAGYLRSKLGGAYDVVALRISSGHINILTRPAQRVDLRSLAVLVRTQEAQVRGVTLEGEPSTLSLPGSLKEVPEWYYDTATNSLLNGGPNPQNISPTQIDPFEFQKLLELGLSERLWRP